MNVNGFGLLNAFCLVLNSGVHNSDYAIALYLMPRLGSIQDVSITDIIDNAYVTRSAVRRFCNRMGFTSFSDLKEGITSALFPSDLNARDLSQGLESYRRELDAGIQGMFTQMNRVVTDTMIEELAQELHSYSHVVLTCAGNTSGVLNRFQQELFFAGKLTEVVTSDYESRLTGRPNNNPCLLVAVSASGVFARSFEYCIRKVEAKKVLITANLELADWDAYDHVLCLSEDQEGRDALGIYGKYGVSYFFDLLSSAYLHRFGYPISK